MPRLSVAMKELVERQRLGFIATVCADGTPNLSPKGTLCVLDDEHLIFADLRSPGTIANLRTNPSIEVNVVDHFLRKGFRFKGTAQVLEAGPDFERHVSFFSELGVVDAPTRIRAIVVILVEEARALISPGYERTPSEEAMRAYWREYYCNQDIEGGELS